MSLTIFKNSLKRSWKLLLIFFILICSYLGVIISLIDPKDMEKIKELFGAMGDMLGVFGISIETMTSPLAYTASTFFGVLVLAFSMVFYIIMATSLIAKPVDDTSIAYTLSAPITRTRLAITQGIYLIFSMLVLFAGVLALGTAMLSGMGGFDFTAYFKLVSITFMLCTSISMLSFFLSVAFCDSKLGVGLATGVPIILLLMSMLGGAGGEATKWLKSLTPFGWLDSVGIINGSVEVWWMYISYSCAIILLLAASAVAFNKKQLSI